MFLSLLLLCVCVLAVEDPDYALKLVENHQREKAASLWEQGERLSRSGQKVAGGKAMQAGFEASSVSQRLQKTVPTFEGPPIKPPRQLFPPKDKPQQGAPHPNKAAHGLNIWRNGLDSRLRQVSSAIARDALKFNRLSAMNPKEREASTKPGKRLIVPQRTKDNFSKSVVGGEIKGKWKTMKGGSKAWL